MNHTSDHIGTIELSCPAFSESHTIPIKYSGQGQNISPPLAWSSGPEGTRSFALIVDDPDAPMITFVHWVLYNLPPTLTGLPENIMRDETLPDGARQGINTLHQVGYTGPLPPTKTPHRYFFKLYALDTMLDLEPRASKADLVEAMEGHILAEGQLMGVYQKH